MTVSINPQSVIGTCNGSLQSFPFDFSIEGPMDIQVILTNAAGDQTVLVYTTHYTVTGTPNLWDVDGNPIAWSYVLGGFVNTVAIYASGNILTITTDISLSQGIDFYQGMGNLSVLIEQGLDKITRIIKQQQAQIAALQTLVGAGITLPLGISYLGVLTNDPDTTGWGTAETGKVWFADGRGKYWSGTEILEF